MFLCFMPTCNNTNSSAEISFEKEMVKDTLHVQTPFSPLDSLINVLQYDNFDMKIDTFFNKTIVLVSYKMSFTESRQDTLSFRSKN